MLGIDVESPGAVAGAVLVSLLPAVGLWARAARPVVFATVTVGAVFAVFDVAETVHQLDESRAGCALLPGAVAAGHAAAALIATRLATRPTGVAKRLVHRSGRRDHQRRRARHPWGR